MRVIEGMGKFSHVVDTVLQQYGLDSHSRNTCSLHDPNGRAVLLSFSIVSSLNNYIKSFYEISSNISRETQYDLEYISIEITNEIKKEIVSKLGRKRKAVYSKSSNMKRDESEFGIKTSKKSKNDNQIYYQQNQKVILMHYINIMKIIVI